VVGIGDQRARDLRELVVSSRDTVELAIGADQRKQLRKVGFGDAPSHHDARVRCTRAIERSHDRSSSIVREPLRLRRGSRNTGQRCAFVEEHHFVGGGVAVPFASLRQ
jgi:hypothetical protein